MANTKILEYPYPVTLKCDSCGKEIAVHYSDGGITVIPDCECHSAYSIVKGMTYKDWQRMREQERQELLNRLPDTVNTLLDDVMFLDKQADGTYEYQLYVDYNDKMSTKTAIEILSSPDSMDRFWEFLFDCYFEDTNKCIDEVCGLVKKELAKQRPECIHLLPDLEEWLTEYIQDKVQYKYPCEHYLKQEFKVPIFVDTGDANYDFTLNSVYPSYSGDVDEPIDDLASLVWLAKQQGYSKEQLWNALLEGDVAHPSGFLESVRQEVANESTSINALVLLVKMSLEDLIMLNRLIRFQSNGSYEYEVSKRPYRGKIIIDKNVTCGLYDSWNGGGSCFAIEPEKNIELPISLIHQEVLPEAQSGYGHYSLDSCYGFCGSVWESGRVLEIINPDGFDDEREVKGA